MSGLARFVGVAALSAASAAELKLTWSDCGDSSTHTKITGFTPATISTGTKSTMTGTGDLDEDVTGATFDLEMKTAVATISCKGDASQSKTCNLPLGTGSLTFDAITFPMKKGKSAISVELSLAAKLPGALAKTETKVTSTGSNGDKLFCMDIKSAPAQSSDEVLVLPPSPAASTAGTELKPKTHYGDPKTGCESDEKAVHVQGVPGKFCSPTCKCDDIGCSCPNDKPTGATAYAKCVLGSPGERRGCVLICTPSAFRSNGADGECGTGACHMVEIGHGFCTYGASELGNMELVLSPLTNPSIAV